MGVIWRNRTEWESKRYWCEGKTWQIFNYSRTQLRGKPTITFTMNWKQFLYSYNRRKHVTLETQDIMCPQHICVLDTFWTTIITKRETRTRNTRLIDVYKHCLSNGTATLIPSTTDPTATFFLTQSNATVPKKLWLLTSRHFLQ